MRYYYKTVDGKNFLNLSSPINDDNYIAITEEEFNMATKSKPLSEEQNILRAKKHRLAELHRNLEKLDYIGVKIATGRATREEYAKEIALMDEYALEVNALEKELGL